MPPVDATRPELENLLGLGARIYSQCRVEKGAVVKASGIIRQTEEEAAAD